jgi:hypothetical protein
MTPIFLSPVFARSLLRRLYLFEEPLHYISKVLVFLFEVDVIPATNLLQDVNQLMRDARRGAIIRQDQFDRIAVV